MFELQDVGHYANSVSVTGPGLAAPFPITYDVNKGRWSTSTANNMTLVAGATYTYTVVDAVGSTILTESIMNPIITQAPTNVLPANGSTVSTTPTFSWGAVTVGTPNYGVQIFDGLGGMVWETYLGSTTTSVAYNGAPLADGVYQLLVGAEFNSGSGIMNHGTFAQQTFTYQAAATAVQISGTVTNNSVNPTAVLGVDIFDFYTSTRVQAANVVGNTYTVSGLADGSYYVVTFVDTNANGIFDPNLMEPNAYSVIQVVAGQPIATVNLTIERYMADATTRCDNFSGVISYNVEFRVPDSGMTATSVTVSGGEITAPLSLTMNQNRWSSFTNITALVPNTVYNVQVTDAAGVYNYPLTSSTVSQCITPATLNALPSNGSTVTGIPTFSWNPVAGADYYVVQLNGLGVNWMAEDVSATNVAYSGPALVDGATYTFSVTAGISGLNGTFEHQASTDGNTFTYSAVATPPPVTQITGTIANNSTAVGPLQVLVWSTEGASSGTVVVTGNTFTIGGLTDGYYSIDGFVDVNGDGFTNGQETLAQQIINVTGGVPSAINVGLVIEQYQARGTTLFDVNAGSYGVRFVLVDSMATATAVTVSGTGLAAPLPLTYTVNSGEWAGQAALAASPASSSYTYSITDNLGVVTTLSELAMPTLPTGAPVITSPTVGQTWSTAPVFNWAPAPNQTIARVELWGGPGAYWQRSGNNTATYDGAPLADGTYSYMVASLFYDMTGGNGMPHANAVIQNNALIYNANGQGGGGGGFNAAYRSLTGTNTVTATVVNNTALTGAIDVFAFTWERGPVPTAVTTQAGGVYTISGLADGFYYIGANIDLNANGIIDQGEQVDIQPVIVVAGQPVPNVNLVAALYAPRVNSYCFAGVASSIEYTLADVSGSAASVTVSGGEIITPLPLQFDNVRGSWIGNFVPAALTPNTLYTFSVTDALGVVSTYTESSTANMTCPMPAIAALPASGSTVTGALNFSWAPVANATYYTIKLMDSTSNIVWFGESVLGLSVAYDGPALQAGAYTYEVEAIFASASNLASHTVKSNAIAFTYVAGNNTVTGTVVNNSAGVGPLMAVAFDNVGNGVPVPVVAGSYTISGLADGVYDVLGFVDGNSNGQLDNQEMIGWVSVTLGAGAMVVQNLVIGQYNDKPLSVASNQQSAPRINDFMGMATSVTLTGPGLAVPENLVFDVNTMEWVRPINATVLTFVAGNVYTYTVTDALGTTVFNTTVTP